MTPPTDCVINVDEHDFAQKVIEESHHRPVIVDFWAEWCGPCRSLTPLLERVVRSYEGAVLLAKVEADENMRLAGHYRLRGFPTCLLFSGGEVQGHFTGMKPEHFLREFIDNKGPHKLDNKSH